MSKVGNTIVSVPQGIELNEKDYCACLLSTLKEMEKNYVVAMTEASNEWLYGSYRRTFLDLAELERELYILMFQKGWYQLESVETNKIIEKYDLFNNDYRGLSESL